MILFNTTFIVENDKVDHFLKVVKEQYIPNMLEKGVMHSPKLHKVLSVEEGANTTSYALHLYADDYHKLIDFMDNYAAHKTNRLMQDLKPGVTGFSSILIEIEE